MASASNPLVGSAWGGNAPNPINQSLFQLPTPTQVQQPQTISQQTGNPGGLPNPATNEKDASRNQAYLNTILEQQKSQLIPQFTNQMFSTLTPAAQTYANFANAGSPYYQQQQQSVFNQGVLQNQNAQALAKQQLGAAGYGYSPSGATAGMIGGMNQQGAQNLVQNYLQTLFNNANLMLAGAQGLGQIGAQYNPAGLFGYSSPQSTQGPDYSSLLSSAMGAAGTAIGGRG